MVGVPGQEILEGLDPDQREAVTSDAEPLAVLAGAGGGKTRVLTRRIAWRVATERCAPDHVLALTFTRKAAGELVGRLSRLGVRSQVTAGTFHAVALAQLRRRAAERGRTLPTLLERKAGLLVRLIGAKGPDASVAARDLATEIEWAKARCISPGDYEAAALAAGRTPGRSLEEVTSVFVAYEQEKRRRGLLDFGDIVHWCVQALERDTEFAAVQRWRFRHLFVDEFQDASPAQVRLVRGWLGPRRDLCVVGDPDQAIYGFAGADPGYLAAFARHFVGGSVVRLGTNYRSTPQIVAAARAVLPTPTRRLAVRAAREPGPAPTATGYDTEDDEARAIAVALREHHAAGVPWSAMAVLYRINAQSAVFEEALGHLGVPMRVRGDGRFLQRPEVRAALDAMRAGERSRPGRPLVEHLADLAEDAADAPDERRSHVEALGRLGREYLTIEGGAGSLAGFLAFLPTALADDGADGDDDAVELLTFHRAKGLEFDVVFVTGVERGLVPIAHAGTRHELDEERRLLYVAMSRAERELHVSWAMQRSLGMRVVARVPSPWVQDIEAATLGSAPAPAPRRAPGAREQMAAARRRAAGGGERLRATRRATRPAGAPDEIDLTLLDALKQWRRDQARAAQVPVLVIADDRTLKSVAGTRPHSRDELADLPGIGPLRLERYGDALLDLVLRHDA